jgi:phosphoribosyl-dephospho-CoA transferase
MRPHDLLRLKPGAIFTDVPAPTWVAKALSFAPFVVVRRGACHDGRIPVGIRGNLRAQRFPASVRVEDVVATITPEDLAASATWRTCPRRELAAIAALDRVAAAAELVNLAWGPGGSVGFELASGAPAVHETSDLDVIVRPTKQHSPEDLRHFAQTFGGLELPAIDIVVEAEQGAVALREWLQSPMRVLIKTPRGPELGAFHW